MSATIIHPRRQRLQRSELAVPATSERFFEKAREGTADAIFFDLEDAVSDRLKEDARRTAIQAINQMDWGNKAVAVRVNGLDTRWGLRDIIDVVTECPRLDMVLLPKCGTAFDVRFVEQILVAIEREHNREKRIGIEVLLETAQGVAHAEEIAAASERLEAMIFGVGDFTIDMRTHDAVFGRPSERYAILTGADAGGKRERHWNDQWHFALARIATACRAFGLRPIDGPFTDIKDVEGFRACALRAAALGFEGKWAIHPSQIDTANQIFSPSEEQIAWAKRITEALDAAEAAGSGAFADKGVLIDLAHAKLAHQIKRRLAMINAHEAERSGRG